MHHITEPPEGRKGAVLVVVWGGLAGRGQISKARLLGHGTHPQSPPVLRQGEEMRRERGFDCMSRFSRNFPGRNFLYMAQKIHGGLCGGSAHRRCWGETLYLETRPKVKRPKVKSQLCERKQTKSQKSKTNGQGSGSTAAGSMFLDLSSMFLTRHWGQKSKGNSEKRRRNKQRSGLRSG